METVCIPMYTVCICIRIRMCTLCIPMYMCTICIYIRMYMGTICTVYVYCMYMNLEFEEEMFPFRADVLLRP